MENEIKKNSPKSLFYPISSRWSSYVISFVWWKICIWLPKRCYVPLQVPRYSFFVWGCKFRDVNDPTRKSFPLRIWCNVGPLPREVKGEIPKNVSLILPNFAIHGGKARKWNCETLPLVGQPGEFLHFKGQCHFKTLFLHYCTILDFF